MEQSKCERTGLELVPSRRTYHGPYRYVPGVDSGAPISYLVLNEGTPVLSREGEPVGTVAHVLADEAEDVFDGIVIDARAGPGGHRFADADQVAEIREHAVRLALDRDAAHALPEPSENPAVMGEDPGAEMGPTTAQDKLRRAWDLISGNY